MEFVDLKDKRILYIGCTWFHYDQYLIRKITEYGGLVTSYMTYIDAFYYNVIHQLSYHKSLGKLKLVQLRDKYAANYYKQILSKDNYDYVVIRMGHTLAIEFVANLKKLNPNARFINFHWDSIKPSYNYLPIIDYFDKIYSFDIFDCENNHKIEYLPLFYIDEYAVAKDRTDRVKEIDLVFVGAWRNLERYNLIKLTKEICREEELKFYYYLLSTFEEQMYLIKDHGLIQKEARYRSLSHKKIVKLFSKTNAVIDFPSSFQKGITIRCFETLAAGLKLLTTNKNILKEPFYNPDYITIIDSKNLKIDKDFITSKPTTTMDLLLSNYSIGNYVGKLFQ
jgi:hypothetical protein